MCFVLYIVTIHCYSVLVPRSAFVAPSTHGKRSVGDPSGCGIRNTEYGIRNTEYGIRNTEYGIRNTEYGIRNTAYGIRNTEDGIQNTEYGQRRRPRDIYIYIYIFLFICIYIYIHINRTTHSGSISGSSSGVPTGPAGVPWLYIYICLQSFEQNIGTKIVMSKYSDHNTNFPDTHRHFRLAIEISRIFTVVCGGLELKKEQLEKRTCLD